VSEERPRDLQIKERDRRESKRIREKLDELYADQDSALDPALVLMQSIALPPEKG
jgi:hypothetical protein